jgi:lipopolysaccharide export system protein LptA
MSKFKKGIIAVTLLLGLTFSGISYAAKDAPVQVTAETIEYDANQKLMQAKGNVKVTQEATEINGSYAEYRSENGIVVMNGGITLTNKMMKLTSEQVNYNTNSGIAIASGSPRAEDKDGATLTGTKMEYNAKEDRIVVIGNVNIVHPARKIEATAEHAVYYSKERKIVLTGNAKAVQDGNTLVGETLTVYIDSKAMNATGSTKLIIIPNAKN